MTAFASAKRRPRVAYRSSPIIYSILKGVISLLMRLLYRYETSGQEHVPLCGPLIIVVNHLHLLDPLAVAPAVPRKIVTLAAGKWRDNLLIGTFLRMAGVIFVRRGEVDREALRSCLAVLAQGGVLAVAPEGTRSRTGTLQRAKPGVAYLATRTDATIVPIAIWGVEQIGAWRRLQRPTCRVVIGQPFRLPRPGAKPTTDQLQAWADGCMLRIALLLPERYRGVYAEQVAAIEAGQRSLTDAPYALLGWDHERAHADG